MPRPRLPFALAIAAAFAGGVVFASALDWTRRAGAQGGLHLATGGGPQRDVSGGFASIAERVTPAVVSIQTEVRPRRRTLPPGHGRVPPGFEEYFRQFQQQDPEPERADGSGFLVSRDGYILTNDHVVGDAERVTVTLTDHRAFTARVVGGDPSTDVAVIKIDGANLPVVVFGEDSTARVGDWVVAVGNPLGLDFTVTAGIVSAKGRSRADLPGLVGGTYSITDFLQTDAAINPGNSGGPLVNTRGEVIGINSAIASRTGYFSGYGFAIPISLAHSVMNDLIKHGRVRSPVLGVAIDEVSPADAQVAGLARIAGVLVRGFSPADGSPAEQAGLEAGDVIVAADGHPVDRVSALQRIVREHAPGQVVAVDVMRYGARKSFRVRLAERPDPGAVVGADESGPGPHGGEPRGGQPGGGAPGDPTSGAPASRSPASRSPASGNPAAGAAGGALARRDPLVALGLVVGPVDDAFARAAGLPAADRGVRVRDVARGGPAAALIGAGTDVITDVLAPAPRRHVRTAGDLAQALAGVGPGTAVSFRVYGTAAPAGVRVVNLQVPE